MRASRNVNEIVFGLRVERIGAGKLEQSFVHTLEVPRIVKLGLMQANLRLGRHGSNIASHSICQLRVTVPVKNLKTANYEIWLTAE
jgi:hypothetical protein